MEGYEDGLTTAESVWKVCQEAMVKMCEEDRRQQVTRKRILVSLNEANEVAKRLAAHKRYTKITSDVEDGKEDGDDAGAAGAAEESESVLGDEVSKPHLWL